MTDEKEIRGGKVHGRVLVYTNRLLPYSETFIRDQVRGMKRYTPVYVGCRMMDGLDLGDAPSVVVNNGGLRGMARELRFKMSGPNDALQRRLSALQPTLLHAHFGGCASVSLPIAEALDLPFVVTFHGLDATRSSRDRLRQTSLTPHLYQRRLGRLKKRVDLFLTVTAFMRNVLISQGFPQDRIRVHRLGIDTSRFRPDPAIRRQPVVLFVGRLVEKKGARFLIEAMSRVQQQNPDVELVIIGDGPLRSRLESLAFARLKRFHFMGRQPSHVVREWMNRARVFCVPSIRADSGDTEGCGIVFLEAQAMGTPVVATRTGGIPEAVADGRTGILVPERETEALAHAITRLLLEDAMWTRFSGQGIERIGADFEMGRQGERLENLYDGIIRGRQEEHTYKGAA